MARFSRSVPISRRASSSQRHKRLICDTTTDGRDDLEQFEPNYSSALLSANGCALLGRSEVTRRVEVGWWLTLSGRRDADATFARWFPPIGASSNPSTGRRLALRPVPWPSLFLQLKPPPWIIPTHRRRVRTPIRDHAPGARALEGGWPTRVGSSILFQQSLPSARWSFPTSVTHVHSTISRFLWKFFVQQACLKIRPSKWKTLFNFIHLSSIFLFSV